MFQHNDFTECLSMSIRSAMIMSIHRQNIFFCNGSLCGQLVLLLLLFSINDHLSTINNKAVFVMMFKIYNPAMSHEKRNKGLVVNCLLCVTISINPVNPSFTPVGFTS